MSTLTAEGGPGIPGSDHRAPVPSTPIAADEIVDEVATEGAGPDRRGRLGLGAVLGGVGALWGLLIGLGRLHDNSFLTHLATGRLILDQGGIPRVDPYSFTAVGEPWLVQSWLASVVYAGAEDLGGLGAVRLVSGLLGAVLGLTTWLLTARSRSIAVRLAVTAFVMVAASGTWSGRPLLFGLAGLGAVLLAADGHLDPRWLVPVGWVWVNTHGSFPFAVLVLVLLAVGTRIDTGAWGREPRVLGWAGLGLALGAVNPLGPRLLLFPATVGSRAEAFRSVVEWQAPRYESTSQYLVLAVLLLGVLALMRRPSWRAALPFVVFGGLALTSLRNASPFLLVATPVLAGAVPDLGPTVAGFRRPILRPAAAAVVALALVFGVTELRGEHTALDAYPEEAVAWMEAEGLWGPDSRVVAPDYVGNYREARRGTEARVFMDDRVDMYPLDVLDDYGTLQEAGPEWPEVLDRRAITAVLWKADSPLGGALDRDPGWQVVHRDDPWMVAVPTPPR